MGRLRALSIVCLFYAGTLGSTQASVYAPPQGRSPASDANSTYLRTLNNEAIAGSIAAGRRQFIQNFLPEKDASTYRQDWEFFNRDYEIRSRSGLTNAHLDNAHQEALGAYSSAVLARLFRHQVEKSLRETARRSEEVRSLHHGFEEAGRTVSSTASMASIQEPIGGDLQLRGGAGVILPSSKARLWTESRLVNASLEIQYADPWRFNPWSDHHQAGRERDPLMVLMWRTIPGLNVESTFKYGISTTFVESGFSKQLLPSLRASLNAQTGLDITRAGVNGGFEKIVRLDYELRF